MNTVDFTDRRVEELLTAFEKEREPALVHEALDTIEAAHRDLRAGDLPVRKQAVARFLHFFALLDRNIDPKWNQNDEPVTCVRPPLSSSVIYPNGEVEPSAIPDPAERALYEQALEASKNNYKQHFIQFQLRQISERAILILERLLADKSSSADRSEFEELLRASPVSDVRKEQLRGLWPKQAK